MSFPSPGDRPNAGRPGPLSVGLRKALRRKGFPGWEVGMLSWGRELRTPCWPAGRQRAVGGVGAGVTVSDEAADARRSGHRWPPLSFSCEVAGGCFRAVPSNRKPYEPLA